MTGWSHAVRLTREPAAWDKQASLDSVDRAPGVQLASVQVDVAGTPNAIVLNLLGSNNRKSWRTIASLSITAAGSQWFAGVAGDVLLDIAGHKWLRFAVTESTAAAAGTTLSIAMHGDQD